MKYGALLIASLLILGPLIIVIPAPMVGAAGVDVSGQISTPVTWSNTAGPYRIHGNVSIVPWGVVTIDPGVDVLFDQNSSIWVNGGTLNVMGMESMPVRFLPNTSTPFPGYYQWINATNNPPYNATVNVNWANFSHGIKGLYLQDNNQGYVANCTFNRTLEMGIYASNSRLLRVWDSDFRDNDGYGLYLDTCNNCTIANTSIVNCTSGSVALSGCEYSSVFSCNLNKTGEALSLWGSTNILVSDNTFNGDQLAVKLAGSVNNTLLNNDHLNCARGVILSDSPETVMSGNSFMGCGEGLLLEGGPDFLNNNIDTSNTFEGQPIRYLSGTPSLSDVTAGELVLAGCSGASMKNLTFAKGGHIQIFRTASCSFENISLDSPVNGISVVNSNNCWFYRTSVTNATVNAVDLLGASSFRLMKGNFSNCDKAVSAQDTKDLLFNTSTFENNTLDLRLSNSSGMFLNSVISTTDISVDSNLTEEFYVGVLVQDNATPLSGVDMKLEQTGLCETRYSTPHFGGGLPLTGADGKTPPVPVMTFKHTGGLKLNYTTTCTLWHANRVFDLNPRDVLVTEPMTLVFNATTAPPANGSLSGTVREKSGPALQGALVTLNATVNVTTNGTGGYLFASLAPGVYSINVTMAGYYGVTDNYLVVTPGCDTKKDFELTAIGSPNGNISGTVKDQTGAAVASASVNVTGVGNTITDASGMYTFTGVTPGNYSVLVSKTGYLDSNTPVTVSAYLTSWVNVTLVPLPSGNQTGTIKGKVLSALGIPLSDATISIDSLNRSTLSASDGTYGFINIMPGLYTVAARLVGFQDASHPNVTVSTGNVTWLNITLSRAGLFQNDSLGVRCEVDLQGNATIEIRDAGEGNRPLAGGIGKYFKIEKGNGTKLNWINITVKYDRARLPAGTNESRLRLYYYDKDVKAWKLCEKTGVDIANTTVWANITHLTVFGLGLQGPGGAGKGTSVALPSSITPLALIGAVLIVGVPIGILVIRLRTPPPSRKIEPPGQGQRYRPPEEPF